MKHARLWILPLLLVTAAGLTGCGSKGIELPGLHIVAQPTRMTALVDQKCVFLVKISHQDTAGAVTMAAVAPGTNVTIEPPAITAGQVCEVTIDPSVSALGTTVGAFITGTQGTQHDDETPTIAVIPGTDTRAATAAGLRDKFVTWLAANRADLGITAATTWDGTIVEPDLPTPAHYLYFSDDWEMGLAWSTSSPPNDWALMYLRRRFQELAPSYGLEIDSVSSGHAPAPIGPPLLPYR